MKRITIEEHFSSTKVISHASKSAGSNVQERAGIDHPKFSFHLTGAEIIARTFDLADLRLKEMDEILKGRGFRHLLREEGREEVR